MFDATTGATSRERANPLAGILSLLIHVGLAGGVVVIAAMNPAVVEQVVAEVDVTFFAAAPPPPPPPPPPPAGPSSPKKPKTEKKKDPDPTPKTDELTQPEEIPDEVPVVEDAQESDEVAVAGGVPGGVEGGVEGGVVGGEVGGKEGGVVGGDIHSMSVGDTKGQCKQMASMPYPEMAKAAGVEGTVALRLLMDPTGKVAKRKDPVCTAFEKASAQDQRTRWHPGRCAEAVSGPKEFYYDALTYYGALRCTPYIAGGNPVYYWATLELNFRLQ